MLYITAIEYDCFFVNVLFSATPHHLAVFQPVMRSSKIASLFEVDADLDECRARSCALPKKCSTEKWVGALLKVGHRTQPCTGWVTVLFSATPHLPAVFQPVMWTKQ
jgi:hypothetical protein